MELTKELLHELFDYRDGKLFWKVGNRRGEAGSLKQNGYRFIGINGKHHYTHRLIFLFHHGFLPPFIDHIDGNRLNNSIDNLRVASRSENNRNVGIQRNNTSGAKGVQFIKNTGKWRVAVRSNGILRYFGMYNDFELAELVATEARNLYHGEFARHE